MGRPSANDDTWEADSEVEVMEDDEMEDTQTTSGSFGVWYDEMPSVNIEEDEWTRYLKSPPVRNWNGFHVRNWWLDCEKEFPTLSKMVLDLLAVPSMSTEVERVFSRYVSS